MLAPLAAPWVPPQAAWQVLGGIFGSPRPIGSIFGSISSGGSIFSGSHTSGVSVLGSTASSGSLFGSSGEDVSWARVQPAHPRKVLASEGAYVVLQPLVTVAVLKCHIHCSAADRASACCRRGHLATSRGLFPPASVLACALEL